MLAAIILSSLVALTPALQAGPPDVHTRPIYDLIKKAELPIEPETVAALQRALQSDLPRVRLAAIEALHAFAFIGHGKKEQASREAWAAERLELLKVFKPEVVRALSDPDEYIRHNAVLALLTMDSKVVHDHGFPLRNFLSTAETMNRLARMLPAETSPRVRREILKSFSLLADTRPEVPTERVLVAALDDPDLDVLQMAVSGIGHAGLSQYLPRLVPLLRHPSPGVAQAAAGTFNQLHADAFPFVPELQRAADAAPEGPFKQTLLAAIRLAREKGKR